MIDDVALIGAIVLAVTGACKCSVPDRFLPIIAIVSGGALGALVGALHAETWPSGDAVLTGIGAALMASGLYSGVNAIADRGNP